METFSPQSSGIDINAFMAPLNTKCNKTVLKRSLEQSLLSAVGRVSSGQALRKFTKNAPLKAEKKQKKGKDTSKRAGDKGNRQCHKMKHPKKPPAWRGTAGILIAMAVLCMTMTVFYRVLTHPPEPPPSPVVSTLHTISYSKPLPGHKRRYHRRPHTGRRRPKRARRPEQNPPCGCSE